MSKIGVLFVCTENICRSPMAQAMLEQALVALKLDRLVWVDSAGTTVSQPGLPMDARAMGVVTRYGVRVKPRRSRRIKPGDFERFHYILALDRRNLAALEEMCPATQRHKLALLLDHASGSALDEVPDPYYGSEAGFEKVFYLVDEALRGLVDHIGKSLNNR